LKHGSARQAKIDEKNAAANDKGKDIQIDLKQPLHIKSSQRPASAMRHPPDTGDARPMSVNASRFG